MNPTVYVYEPLEILLTGWNGDVLDPSCIDLPGVGNIVRIIIRDDALGWIEAIYVKITETQSDGFITGEVLDTYRHTVYGLNEPIDDGEKLIFHRRGIMEIPYDWKGNENLKILTEKRTGLYRSITGVP